MTATYTYDGGPLTRVRAGSVSLTQVAEHGRVGTGSFTYDDTPGTQDIVGQKDFSATEDACANPGTFAGFVTVRGYSRKSERQAAAREIDVSLDDLNALLGFRTIYTHSSDGETTENGGLRKAETIAARGTWLLAQEAVTGLFVDNGRCDFSTTIMMDATDCRLSRPGDVLAEMALAAGPYNHYIRDFGDGPELVFRDDNTSTDDTSTISISNVIADVEADALTFYPFKDAVLTRNPAGVVSKINYSYAVKTVTEERAATALAFNGERDGTVSNTNVQLEATARDNARKQLFQLSTEEDSIECMIQVPPEAANLINHGDRVQARFSHLAPEGYGEMTWFRVIECTKAPLLKTAEKYNIALKLSPQEPAQPGTGIVQRAFARANTSTATGVFDAPLTIGNKLVVFTARQLNTSTDVDPPDTSGPWDVWGAGGWTRLNGSTQTAVDVYFNSADELYDGLAAYYKTIDATTQSGHTQGNTIGAWELTSTADLAGATVIYKHAQTTSADPSVFDTGSLGTVDVGELALYCVIFANNVNAGGPTAGFDGDYLPTPAMAPGDFTERWYHGQTDTSYGIWPATYAPVVWMGDKVGDGSSVEASVQKPRNNSVHGGDGVVGWAAIGIKIST